MKADPLALAGISWVIAALLYIFSNAHRFFGFFVAAGLVFAVAGVPYLLALAHHPLGQGLSVAVVFVGAVGGVLLFWFLVIKGHHKHPLLKIKGGDPSKPGGAGQSKKAPHHRAAAAFVLVAVFGFLAVTHWPALMQTGRGGISQTFSGFTQ